MQRENKDKDKQRIYININIQRYLKRKQEKNDITKIIINGKYRET